MRVPDHGRAGRSVERPTTTAAPAADVRWSGPRGDRPGGGGPAESAEPPGPLGPGRGRTSGDTAGDQEDSGVLRGVACGPPSRCRRGRTSRRRRDLDVSGDSGCRGDGRSHLALGVRPSPCRDGMVRKRNTELELWMKEHGLSAGALADGPHWRTWFGHRTDRLPMAFGRGPLASGPPVAGPGSRVRAACDRPWVRAPCPPRNAPSVHGGFCAWPSAFISVATGAAVVASTGTRDRGHPPHGRALGRRSPARSAGRTVAPGRPEWRRPRTGETRCGPGRPHQQPSAARLRQSARPPTDLCRRCLLHGLRHVLRHRRPPAG